MIDPSEYTKLKRFFAKEARSWIGGRLYERASHDDIDDIAQELIVRYIDPGRPADEPLDVLMRKAHADIARVLGLADSVRAKNFSEFTRENDGDEYEQINIDDIICVASEHDDVEALELRIEREARIEQIDAELRAAAALCADAAVSAALDCSSRRGRDYIDAARDELIARAKKKLATPGGPARHAQKHTKVR